MTQHRTAHHPDERDNDENVHTAPARASSSSWPPRSTLSRARSAPSDRDDYQQDEIEQNDDHDVHSRKQSHLTFKEAAHRIKLAQQLVNNRKKLQKRRGAGHSRTNSNAQDILNVIEQQQSPPNNTTDDNIHASQRPSNESSSSRRNYNSSYRSGGGGGGAGGGARKRLASKDMGDEIMNAATTAFSSQILPHAEDDEDAEMSGDESASLMSSSSGTFFLLDEDHEEDESGQEHYGSTLPTTTATTTASTSSAAVDETTPFTIIRGRRKRTGKDRSIVATVRRRWRRVKRKAFILFQPQNLRHVLVDLATRSVILWVGLPCFLLALVMAGVLGNPQSDFLPWRTTYAWWLLFLTRQTVTFDLARIAQWLSIDTFFTNTRFGMKWFGPSLTFFALQSKGWPFLAFAWAAWNFALLFGNSEFDRHWLFFWTVVSRVDSGAIVLRSDIYMRILVSMIIAGLATAGKRTFLVLRFGRRQFVEFKPRLERIIKEVIVVSEVATIAEELFKMDETGRDLDETEVKNATADRRTSRVGWKGVTFRREETASMSSVEDEEFEADESVRSSERTISRGAHPKLSTSESGSWRIKKFLDRWDDPIDKSDREPEVTIADVLKFRTALSYMDMTNPFGTAFGPASNRNECIESAHNVFYGLLKFSPHKSSIPFETLELAAVSEEEAITDAFVTKKDLHRVFRPDALHELTQLAFIQSIDAVYRKLRFFRASVGNASVIDKVLEDIINGIFYFLLGLLLLELLRFNPWTLLVSMTSLLVSVSFALGSSVSKYVEGLLLIAVRRPFDLGDRIILTGPEFVENPGIPASWFVEDISSFTTTLRYALTNEVCTLNNSAISQSRIVNCSRSPNAIVYFPLLTHVKVFDKETMKKFKTAIEEYVANAPRIWDSVAYLRIENIDADNEKVTWTIAVRHRNSWQDAARILLDKSDLLVFVYETTKRLRVHIDSPPARRLIFQGGALERLDVPYKRNYLESSNVNREGLKSAADAAFNAPMSGG